MGLLTAQTVKKFEFPKSKMRDQTRGNVVAGERGSWGGKWSPKGQKYGKNEHLDNYFRFDWTGSSITLTSLGS